MHICKEQIPQEGVLTLYLHFWTKFDSTVYTNDFSSVNVYALLLSLIKIHQNIC